MGFSLLGSSSDTKASAVDKSVQVADQGVVYQPQRSNNTRTTTRLGAGASLTINQGLGADEFNAGLAALAQSLSASNRNSLAGEETFRSTVLDALDKRTAAGTDLAVENITSNLPSNLKPYVLGAVGLVLVFALILVFGGKHK